MPAEGHSPIHASGVGKRRGGAVCAVAAVVTLAAAVAAGCAAPDDAARVGVTQAELRAASYVGRESCSACHAEQEARWRGSDHDLAMQVAEPGTVLGDFEDVTFVHDGREERFFRRGDRFWVAAAGPDGGAGEFPIAFTFGVEPLQQYLIGFPDGRYQALDVAWDSRPEASGGQRWFYLRPGETPPPGDPLHWTGVAYNWNTMCADCHSTDLRKNYDPAADTFATTYDEIDVSCEACHGPGSAHAEWARARQEQAAAAGRPATPAREDGMSAADMGLQVGFPRVVDHAWDIDPESGLARRNPPRAPAYDVEVCGRCHARRGAIADRYRHGAPVSDFYRVALLEEGLYHVDGQILDEVFVYGSFLQSRMYRQGVGCADCHDPHRLETYNAGNSLCNRCHLGSKFDTPEHHHHEVGTTGALCVDCHMPAATYMVVDPRRDHSFRSPRPDLSLEYGVPNACTGCHAEQGARWAADAVVGWFGPERKTNYSDLLAAGRAGGGAASAALRTLAADTEMPPIARATALSLLPASAQASIGVISAALDDPDPLVRAAALTALQGAGPATVLRLALDSLDDDNLSVRLEAARAAATVPPQQIPAARRADVEGALEEYRASQLVVGERAQAHLNLGTLALRRGDTAAAEQSYLTALRLEPMFVPTFINLADLYRLSGRDAEGEDLLRRALAIAPDSGDVSYALGLLLVREERLREAVEMLRRATRLAPQNPHYAYVYAVAVQTDGDARAAVRILDDALERFPEDRELLFGAAAFSRDLGEIDRAIAYVRRMVAADPNDGEAAAFLRDLEALRLP